MVKVFRSSVAFPIEEMPEEEEGRQAVRCSAESRMDRVKRRVGDKGELYTQLRRRYGRL